VPSRVAIDPGLVLALARLLRNQAAMANEAANTSAHVAAAVELSSPVGTDLDSVADMWRCLGASLESRALLAAGFTLNLPAPNFGVALVSTKGGSRFDRFTYKKVWQLVETVKQLSDRELGSMWAGLSVKQRAMLLDALLTTGYTDVAVRLALVSDPLSNGRSRLDGSDLLEQIGQWLPLLEVASGSIPDGTLSYDELVLAASAEQGVLPEWLAIATSTFASSPSLFETVAWSRAGVQDHSTATGAGSLLGYFEVRNTITVADIDEAVTQIGIAKLLADPTVFDRLDAAKTGAANGHVSIEDVEIAIDNGWYGSAETELLKHLIIPGVFSRIESTDDRARGTQLSRGRLYWTDVASLAINLHAFASEPSDALQFLEWLPKPYLDPTGRTHGLDIRLSSDDGIRALASAALAGTNGIVEQTLVVAALPESAGGERNQLITLYYSELGLQMNNVLNARYVDNPMDPTEPNHSGANWMLMAPWASNSIRPALLGAPVDISLFFDQAPSVGDRQQLADGNQTIFGDIAPRYAAVVAAARDGVFENPDSFVEFFANSTLPDRGPMFSIGHNQLRDGFAYLAAAVNERDAAKRQHLTNLSNTLLAIHEQAAVQPQLAALTDLGVGDDGIVRGIGGEIFAYVQGGDAVVATSLMTLSIGQPDRRSTIELRVSNDLEPNTFAKSNNLIVDTPLTALLDPDRRRVVNVDDAQVHLRGGDAEFSLPDLGGWNNPPPEHHRDAFPTSARTWYDAGTNNVIILPAGEPPVFITEGRSTPGTNNLAGTGAVDWGDPDDRMWYIANLFQQSHTEPKLWDLQYQLGLDRTHDGTAAFGYLPATVRSLFGKSSRRNRRD